MMRNHTFGTSRFRQSWERNPMIVRTERKLVIVIAPLEKGHATSRSPKQRRSGREDRTRVERGRIVPARVVKFAASSSRSASASREVPWRRVLDRDFQLGQVWDSTAKGRTRCTPFALSVTDVIDGGSGTSRLETN